MFGFVESGGVFTTLNYPVQSPYLIQPYDTYALGISGSNVVGYYRDELGNSHGFFATTDAVPEPTSLGLLVIGACGWLGRGRAGFRRRGGYPRQD